MAALGKVITMGDLVEGVVSFGLIGVKFIYLLMSTSWVKNKSRTRDLCSFQAVAFINYPLLFTSIKNAKNL